MKARYLICLAAITHLSACGDRVQAVERRAESGQVMRIHGEFDIRDDFNLAAKPPGNARSSRQMIIKGSFDQLVNVEPGRDDELKFTPVEGKPMHFTATISEEGRHHSDDPDSATIVKVDSSSSFSGPVSENMDLRVRRSKLGAGDEISMRLESTLTGKETTVATMSGTGAVQTLDNAANGFMISLLESVNDSRYPNRRRFVKDVTLAPTLGERPGGGLEQQLYDGMKTFPATFHTGLATSPGRNQWHYKGTVTHADSDKPTETMKWTETIAFDLRLEKP